MEISNTVYFSLGSNIGDRLTYIQLALKEIKKKIGLIISCSSVYSTEAVGFKADTEFLNICICCNTFLEPQEILDEIKYIENQLGRRRSKSQRYASRTVDIDIIFYNNLVFENEKIQIPHREYQKRLFVLLPLLEISPNQVDPRDNQLILEILRTQKLNQSIRKENFVLSY